MKYRPLDTLSSFWREFSNQQGSTCNKDAGIFNKLEPSDFLKTDNPELYHAIVEHRRMLTSMKEVDYSTHVPEKINFVPPIAIIDLWRKDYETMQSNMIYGYSLAFNRLINRLKN